jgi:tetratricopeptide (TPR) repeat protein
MIMTLFSRTIPIILMVTLAACTSVQHKITPSSDDQDYSVLPPVSVGTGGASPLTPDIIYNILVGEIALQRQDLGSAYTHQLKGAGLAHDAVAAERATRIALHQKNQADALVAVKRWIQFASDDPQARQMAVMLYIQLKDYAAAQQHLLSLVHLREKQGRDGFAHAIAAVTSGGDREQAVKLMQSLASSYQGNPRASYAVALTAVLAKQFDLAEREARRSIQDKPDMEKAYVLLSRIYLERKDTAGAMRVMQDALNVSPDSRILRSAYARLLVDLNKPELAYKQFQKLAKLMPNDADVQFSLGILALQLKRHEQAADHFNKLIKAGKRAVDASFYMGRIAEMEGKPKAAIDWYRRVKEGKYQFDALARTAGLVADQGNLHKARSMLGDMRSITPKRSVDLYILEGELLRKHSTNDEVVGLYNAALKAHPDDLDLLYARALSASAQGRVDILERDIRVILKQKPDHADALNALGYTLADQTDRYQEALGYIQKALVIKPDSPAILDSMGWVQYRMGNNEEALRYLRRAFDKEQDVEIAAHLMELLWMTGQKQEAQKVLQGALKKTPDNKYLQQAIKRLGI